MSKMRRVLKQLSQRTLVHVMRALEDIGIPGSDMEEGVNFTQLLYESEFPGWFVLHARERYNFHWQEIIIDLRSTKFFYPGYCDEKSNVTGGYLSRSDAQVLGEVLNKRLAVHAARMDGGGETVRRSLELDGLRLEGFELIPIEAVVNEQEEEGRVVMLVRAAGITNQETILRHLRDAQGLFVAGKDHSSIGEDRSFIQALIDAISGETHAHGGYSNGYPAGTANRLQYLEDVRFFTEDEKTAFGSAWGFLSAGSHPGIPSREEARIGLILALEFGQLLLLKFANWKANSYKGFN